MAKVHFFPEPGTPDITTTLGHTFDKNRPTEVTEERALGKLRNNTFFKVDDGKAPKALTTSPDGAHTSTVPTVPGLRATHRGGGRFSIMDGDKEVQSGLTKDDAHAFNDMSDEDKAAYVASAA